MASVHKDGKGWQVCYIDPDGNRRSRRQPPIDAAWQSEQGDCKPDRKPRSGSRDGKGEPRHD